MPIKVFIYKIIDNNNPNEFYIGSTVNVSRRKSHHKKNTYNKVGKRYWTKLYLYIRENGGWEQMTFEVLLASDYDTKQDARKEEQNFIDNLKPTLNSISAIKK